MEDWQIAIATPFDFPDFTTLVTHLRTFDRFFGVFWLLKRGARSLLDDLLVNLGDLSKLLRSRRSDLVDHVKLHLEVVAVVSGRIQVVE